MSLGVRVSQVAQVALVALVVACGPGDGPAEAAPSGPAGRPAAEDPPSGHGAVAAPGSDPAPAPATDGEPPSTGDHGRATDAPVSATDGEVPANGGSTPATDGAPPATAGDGPATDARLTAPDGDSPPTAGGVSASDTGVPPATSPGTPVVLGADGLPDPSQWIFDPTARARDWLDRPPIDPDDLARRPEAYRDMLDTHGLFLDVERGQVFLRGATLHDPSSLDMPVEYLVVTELGKTHEAVVLVRAQASVVDACVRALGLVPGGHTRFEMVEPDGAVGQAGGPSSSPWLVSPAHGPVLDIEVAWVGDDGRPRRLGLETLLLDIRTGRTLTEEGWIFTSSARAPYRQGRGTVEWFRADVEGNIATIYLAGLDVCLFERNSLEGLDDTLYLLDPARVPPRGTPVTLVITARDERVAPSGPFDLDELLPPPPDLPAVLPGDPSPEPPGAAGPPGSAEGVEGAQRAESAGDGGGDDPAPDGDG